ncbi:MAG TPA: acyl-CoA dehydrogenase [Steroidobacteraceae bacterium]|nr:acyl-CoA dehydrogenase [Steroidobacteraceae bacterium]
MTYAAPVAHMRFVLEHTAGLDCIRALPAFAEVTPDVVDAVLEGAARFATEVLAPLNAVGDRIGSSVTPNGVTTPPGFREAYRRFVADGWNSLGGPPDYGGQGMPFALHAATVEIWGAANMAFALCPELGSGAIAALTQHATPALRARFLPKLVSGEWAGTMCLTEPQAGSDLSTVTTRAEPAGEGWRLRGRKIYITWGEHDLTDNIVHLVLARAPNAPSGVKGLSLFVAPRYRVLADGRCGEANDIRCVSVEHKMGIHASPTCVLALGDGPGAEAFLVGGLHQGLPGMFTMMNHMRLGVGEQALGVAEHAYQIAVQHARERLQGRDADGKPTVILAHADVRRMLLTMKSLVQAGRGLTYAAAVALDVAHHAQGAPAAAAQARADLLTPVVKAWCSDLAIEVTSLAVQVLGGMGFTEDAGAAQCYRDVRITSIYEGTNGIQAQDLLGRKVLRDDGRALATFIAEMRQTVATLPAGDPRIETLRRGLGAAIDRAEAATRSLLEGVRGDADLVGATSVHYLQLIGYVCGGWQWARSVIAAHGPGAALGSRQTGAVLDCAAFYASQILPRALMHAAVIDSGVGVIVATDAELL